MRHAILIRLYEHLEETYGVEMSREMFTNGSLSIHQVDALLSYKSNPVIDALRGALERLEDGSYGCCLACKRTIPQEALDMDPTRRLCDACEVRVRTEMLHAVMHGDVTEG
jgi:RNA polymerase-binding transcription factor DksA